VGLLKNIKNNIKFKKAWHFMEEKQRQSEQMLFGSHAYPVVEDANGGFRPVRDQRLIFLTDRGVYVFAPFGDPSKGDYAYLDGPQQIKRAGLMDFPNWSGLVIETRGIAEEKEGDGGQLQGRKFRFMIDNDTGAHYQAAFMLATLIDLASKRKAWGDAEVMMQYLTSGEEAEE